LKLAAGAGQEKIAVSSTGISDRDEKFIGDRWRSGVQFGLIQLFEIIAFGLTRTRFRTFDPDCGWRIFGEEFFRAHRATDEFAVAVWTGEMEARGGAVTAECAFEGADECV
jgi:hypothetical protein